MQSNILDFVKKYFYNDINNVLIVDIDQSQINLRLCIQHCQKNYGQMRRKPNEFVQYD